MWDECFMFFLCARQSFTQLDFFFYYNFSLQVVATSRGANEAETLHFVFMSFEFEYRSAAKENYIAMGDNGIKISSPKVIKLNIVAIQVHFK